MIMSYFIMKNELYYIDIDQDTSLTLDTWQV